MDNTVQKNLYTHYLLRAGKAWTPYVWQAVHRFARHQCPNTINDLENRLAIAQHHYLVTLRWEHYLDTQKQRRRLQWWSLLALVINIITTLIALCLPMM